MSNSPRSGTGGGIVIALFSLSALVLPASTLPAAEIERTFLRGNANGDKAIDISDAIYNISFMFLGGKEPPCMDAADANDDGVLDISDVSFLLGYQFLGTRPPPAPGPKIPGPDPTPDALGCGPPFVQAPYEPPEDPLASPSTTPKVTVRGWDPKQKKAIIGKATSVDALRIRGRGLDFNWVLTYRSRFAASSSQGNGWTHSYDVRIERANPGPAGAAIVLRDGTGRGDRYEQHADQVYSAPGFFIEGLEGADGRFTFTFPDGGVWIFGPLDGSPAAGRIETIRDRNGNQLQFIYQHNQTDLEFLRVRDTLDREITATYGPGGRVASLLDFTGRQVTFEYYQDGDAGGSAGDLKSVTTPPFVVGNDPPVARTTTFTYSKGFADERLNHNLLTVTDPKGQRALTIEYSSAVDPADPSFDRPVRWTEGEGAARRGAVVVFYGGPHEPFRVEAVDLAGNVDEVTYDESNRPARLREFTGRSDPAQPVTDDQNRPTGKLRATDPDVFTTFFEWNEDSLLTRCVFPEKNEVRLAYQEGQTPPAAPRARANLSELRRIPDLRGGDTEVERFEYDPRSNQVTRAVDPLGNVGASEYDDHGNLVRFIDRIPSSVHDYEHNQFGQLTAHIWPDNGSGQRRREEYEYHDAADGPQNGYLKTVRIRLTPIDSEIGYQTDAVGNVVSLTDPRGNVWTYHYNALDELDRVTSPAQAVWDSRSEVWSAFRDMNGNIVREDVLNFDQAGNLSSNPEISTIHEFDALDRPVRKFQEAGSADLDPSVRDGSSLPASEFVATEYRYDAAGDLAGTRPAGAPGETVNEVTLEHDERGLLFRRTRGAGTPDASTDQFDYDGNGNRIRVLLAPDFLRLKVSFDGHDRPVRVEDALGNAEVVERDAAGRVVVRFDLADSTGDPADVKARLAETRYEYDAMDRLLRRARLADPSDRNSLQIVTECSYSDASQVVQVLDPNGHPTRYAYDAACRLASITDALGNSRAYEYDLSSNLARRTDIELNQGTSTRFEIAYEHDALDSRSAMTDGLGNTVRYLHDSRSNLVEVQNAAGGHTEYRYDGERRLVSCRRVVDGQAQDIIERQSWDSSSRLVGEIDPNGNSTHHLYNSRDLLVSTTFADGTERRFEYDLRDNLVQSSDPNGTVVKYDHDALDRLVRKSITPGAGVSGAITFEEFRYDGLSRLIGTRNDLSAASFSFDALSRLTRETLDQRATAYEYDPAGNVLSLTYPGGLIVHYAYDALDREVSVGVDQAAPVVKDAVYDGPDRLLSRVLGNGVASSWEYDEVRRKVHAIHHGENQPNAVSERRHSWDHMYRLAGSADPLPGGFFHQFTYDPAHRLVGSVLGSSGTPPRTSAYTLDPSSNRREVLGAIDPGRYLLDPTLPEPADLQMNQYTATPFDQRTYDRNGNLLRFSRPLPGRVADVACTYDYADRLVEVAGPATGEKVSIAYDPLGRRSSMAGESLGARSYAGMELIEDARRGAVYVYSGGAPIAIDEGGQVSFILHDGLENAAALADAKGNLIESYEYGDFGLPRIFDPQGSPIPESKAGNPFLQDGLEYDGDTGLYFDCASGVHFDPRAGRNVNTRNGNPYAMYSIQKGCRNILIGGDQPPMISDFGMARRGSSTRGSDGLVFNVVNPRAARLAWDWKGDLRGEAFFKSVSGLESETEVVPYREGGVNDVTYKRPGPTRFSHIVLKRGLAAAGGGGGGGGMAFFKSVSGLESETEVVEYQEGGVNDSVRKLLGRTKYSNIVLKRGVTRSKTFFKWVFDAANRDVKRMGGKITLCRIDDSPVIDWATERAYPVKWEGPELDASKNEVAIESIEIAHEGLKMQPGGGGGGSANRATSSDNGWGSCFNCHPFGLESQANLQKDSRRFQTLSNASKARHTHDTVKNSINNVR